ncbi:MAG: DMT family transporter [Fimbriimonadaceae bacterium]|nr:DMT family transporter [Fimbriimonadaceae bacterium]
MPLHRTSGRWRLGLALALVPACLWGTLPLAGKQILPTMSGLTVAWYRFAGAALILLLILGSRRQLPARPPVGRNRLLLVVAVLGLAGNYACWMVGLAYVDPATSGVFVQTAPLFLAAGAWLVFRERISGRQAAGLAALVGGLLLYSQQEVSHGAAAGGQYGLGVALLLSAALSWSFYALAQKQLLVGYSSQQIMLLVYGGSALVLWPWARPAEILRLDATQVGCLVYCILNTLVAYGSLAEAFEHWEASRISAVLPLSPLFTLLFGNLLHLAWPQRVPPDHLTLLGFGGALLVVGGAMTAALSSRTPAPSNEPTSVPEDPPC